MKNATTKLKNSGFNTFNHAEEKKTVHLKTEHLKLSSQSSEKKKQSKRRKKAYGNFRVSSKDLIFI